MCACTLQPSKDERVANLTADIRGILAAVGVRGSGRGASASWRPGRSTAVGVCVSSASNAVCAPQLSACTCDRRPAELVLAISTALGAHSEFAARRRRKRSSVPGQPRILNGSRTSATLGACWRTILIASPVGREWNVRCIAFTYRPHSPPAIRTHRHACGRRHATHARTDKQKKWSEPAHKTLRDPHSMSGKQRGTHTSHQTA